MSSSTLDVSSRLRKVPRRNAGRLKVYELRHPRIAAHFDPMPVDVSVSTGSAYNQVMGCLLLIRTDDRTRPDVPRTSMLALSDGQQEMMGLWQSLRRLLCKFLFVPTFTAALKGSVEVPIDSTTQSPTPVWSSIEHLNAKNPLALHKYYPGDILPNGTLETSHRPRPSLPTYFLHQAFILFLPMDECGTGC